MPGKPDFKQMVLEEIRYRKKLESLTGKMPRRYKLVPKNIEVITNIGKKRKCGKVYRHTLNKVELSKLLNIGRQCLDRYIERGIVPEPEIQVNDSRSKKVWSRKQAYKILSDLLIYFNLYSYVNTDILGIIREYTQENK